MFAEYDEGLGVSPTSHSIQRDFPTFQPDEDYSYAPSVKNATKSFVFPQKLDLSTFPSGCSASKNKIKKHGKKKPSPIKAHHDSSLNPRESRRNSSIYEHFAEQTVDLDSFRKEIEAIAANVLNNSMRKQPRSSTSSVTSDRAPSVSSSSTASLGQRSLSVQIKRAKELVDRINADRNGRVEAVFENSDFHLTSDDETRPPSSQASLAYEVERRNRHTSDVITDRPLHRNDRIPSEPRQRSVATGTSVILSDSVLEGIYSRRDARKMAERTMGSDEVFEVETPILTRNLSSGSKRIEVGRNAPCSASITNVCGGEKDRFKEPTILHHSLSSTSVPQKLQAQKTREMQENAHINRSLPNLLERFVVRPSTREIFNTPLDIDAICGKGLRRNQKSSDRIFGGSEIARNIHGDEIPKHKKTALPSAASRPTTASNAKRREPSRSRSDSKQPPYCSATPTDGVSYSIGTVSQQLLGTVKSLHPDWLPMVRRILDDKSIIDVAEAFSEELRKQQMAIEMKFSRNQRIQNSEEFDDHRSRLCVIFRVLEKIGELRSRGGHYSRVQQVKLIHNALLSA